jgi:hypothetical protein
MTKEDRETAAVDVSGDKLLALVDQEGIARVYPVDRTQLEAVFATVGAGSPFEGPNRTQVVFYPVSGTDQGIDDDIGDKTLTITRLSEVMGLLQLAACREKELSLRHEYWDGIAAINNTIRDIAKETDVLIHAVNHSQREAKENGRADIEI